MSDYSSPLEGSIFTQLQEGGVTLENDGEEIGGFVAHNSQWPGGGAPARSPTH